MNTQARIKQLEKTRKATEPNDNKIFVYMFGEDGRVSYGSEELLGMTPEEVTAYTGVNKVIRVIPASEDKDGDE